MFIATTRNYFNFFGIITQLVSVFKNLSLILVFSWLSQGYTSFTSAVRGLHGRGDAGILFRRSVPRSEIILRTPLHSVAVQINFTGSILSMRIFPSTIWTLNSLHTIIILLIHFRTLTCPFALPQLFLTSLGLVFPLSVEAIIIHLFCQRFILFQFLLVPLVGTLVVQIGLGSPWLPKLLHLIRLLHP